ncbi:NAD(P)-dependent dehydrogenase (short-subunit alcohol dehydrogenase family) [Streptomyces aurantiacus]|nr:NAD(P)-dependent dehydrogenase (short-subunit alcohol dehydrogenase family) [Streptomyces aurantiacus]
MLWQRRPQSAATAPAATMIRRFPCKERAHVGQALGLTCDVTSEDDVRSALDDTVQAFGRLDAAFNNAGVEQPVKSAADIRKDEWDRVIVW